MNREPSNARMAAGKFHALHRMRLRITMNDATKYIPARAWARATCNLNTVRIYYLVIQLANLHNPNLFKLIFVTLSLSQTFCLRWPLLCRRARLLVPVSCCFLMFPYRLSMQFRLFSFAVLCTFFPLRYWWTAEAGAFMWLACFCRSLYPPSSTVGSRNENHLVLARVEFPKWILFTFE